jgi:hypothetical protein
MAQVSNVIQKIILANADIDETKVLSAINNFNIEVNTFLATIPKDKIREVRTEILLPFVTQKLAFICFITYES